MASTKQHYQHGYQRGARDARNGQWNPDSIRYQNSKNYREGYGQAHTDHHKIGPAPLAKAPHLRPVLSVYHSDRLGTVTIPED